jgi:hypothetical protein
MNATELRSLEAPIASVPPDEVPPGLVERAAAYNAAVEAFRHVVSVAASELRAGAALDAGVADALRTCASDLVAAREWLLDPARLPSRGRRR